MSQSFHYLDYSATTPIDDRVLEAMLPYFQISFGNPSSVHRWGQEAEAALETSREIIAECLNCSPGEIIFTSGGSESNNLVTRGTVLKSDWKSSHPRILTTTVEHPSVTNTIKQLVELFNVQVDYLEMDDYGCVNPSTLRESLNEDTALDSIIYANNEVGTVNNIRELGTICRERGIPFHSDGVQASNHLSLDVEELSVDLLSLGAHKCYGPKGIGVLYAREGTRLTPHQTGGSQEGNIRGDTPSIPLIVGFAEAFKWAVLEQEMLTTRLWPFRHRVIEDTLATIDGAYLTGHPVLRLPNHASFVFDHVDSTALVAALDLAGFACSAGSACKAGNTEPSGILLSLGWSEELTRGALRVTMGRSTTASTIHDFIDTLPGIIHRLREVQRTG